jgi:Reverse transcriptase (RNA-dependent DNA polymerase)
VIIVVVLVYVDDMTVAGPKLVDVVEFKSKLGEVLDITNIGELTHILGIEITRDRQARTIRLNQTAYVREILNRYRMSDCAPVSTPLVMKDKLTAAQCPMTAEEKQAVQEYANGASYPERVGSLLYATQTRPDCQYAVATLAQFSSNPGRAHFEAVKRVLRYLKGTAHFGLTLGGSGDGVDIIRWTDSDWAQDTDTRRSVGGFVFEVAGGSVSWSSKKQPTVALSTVEAEYMAAANATKEAIWLRTLLQDLGFTQVQATTIWGDNTGCIALAHNPIAHSRAKHIDIRHHFIRERIASDEINLVSCSTKDMIADIFTKALPRESFEKFRDALGVGE